MSVICLEADDPGFAMLGMGTSSDPFDEWFRERVRDIHGIRSREPSAATGAGPRLQGLTEAVTQSA